MKMTASDMELLHRYAQKGSEESFTALVRRHLDLVYSAALRQVRLPQLAQEVAQSVFIELSRSADKIKPDSILSAWLYEVTRHRAIDVVRRESRRQLREQIASEMTDMTSTTSDWTQIEPRLEEAMEALEEADRSAILLRYFQNKSLREVGRTLGTSEDAAQKRVSRAVERLREFFSKRKLTVGAAGLAAMISANAVQAAPLGLSTSISAAAVLSGAASHTATTIGVTKTIAMTTAQKTLIAATIAASLGTGIYEASRASRLEDQVQTLQAAAIAAVSTTPAASVRTTPVIEPRVEDTREEAKAAKRDIPLLIARARLEFGDGLEGGVGGMMNIRRVLRAIAPIAELDHSQIPEALAEVGRSIREPQQKMIFNSLLLGQWAETDGRAAMTYAQEKLEKGSMFDTAVTSSVVASWARRDPEAVWKWLETENKNDPHDRIRGMAVTSIFADMAVNNLDSALARVGALDEQSRAMALNGIASSASDDASRGRLLERTASLPPEQRAQVRQKVSRQWAMNDPDGALAWIRSLPAEEQKPVRESAGQMMLMMKPALGAEVLLEGADEKNKPRLYEEVASLWAQQDARAAGEWLTKQPQGPELDRARRSFARVVAQLDPAAAMDWARSVQNEKQRTESVGQIYLQWHAKDAAAADAALGASGLPLDKVKQLREAQ